MERIGLKGFFWNREKIGKRSWKRKWYAKRGEDR